MADLNRVTLVGRLTRDAEVKYTATTGVPVRRFSIAVNRYRKGDDGRSTEEASFFDIVLWGDRWDSVGKYLVKGKQIAIDGELRQDRWTQQDGQPRSRVEIVAQNIQLLSRDQGTASSAGGYAPSRKPEAQPDRVQHAPQGRDADMDSAFPDDIPF